MSIFSTLDRMAAEERSMLVGSDFIAPCVNSRGPQQHVSVRVCGVICDLIVTSAFDGWGIFRGNVFRHAILMREATLAERERYLELFSPVRMLIAEVGEYCSGVLANRSDNRVTLTGPAPIMLASEVQLFDQVVTRFDGSQFVFDSLDNRRSSHYAEALREQASELTELEPIPGMSREERELYGLVLESRRRALEQEKRQLEESKRQTAQGRLASALEHSGAKLRSYIERADGYTVEYTVGRQRHTSVVDKNLRVRAAGICLSGRDGELDLCSLVGVIREGDRTGKIYRVGVNMDDDDEYD